jgi:hypothetical protein
MSPLCIYSAFGNRFIALNAAAFFLALSSTILSCAADIRHDMDTIILFYYIEKPSAKKEGGFRMKPLF